MIMVGIVVVTYNRLSLLKENIQALREQTYKDYHIIVVNNGSTDGTCEWLIHQSDLIVLNQENLGGAGGFYTGLKYVAEHTYEFCWLMDDDTIPQKEALASLMNAIPFLGNGWGFLCSRVLGVYGKLTNVPDMDMRLMKNGCPDWGELLQYGLVKVRRATFVSVLLPIDNIKSLGLPIKEFFIWGDDTEYTLRLSKKHPSYLVSNSIVVHKRFSEYGLSFLQEKSNRLNLYFYMFRNHYYIAKHGMYDGKMQLMKCYLSNFLLFVRAIYELKFKHARVILKAFIASVNFNPQREYPSKII